jgi:signal transduction histidine kinase
MHLRRISETVSDTSERLKALSDQLNDSSLKEEMARTTTEIYAGALHDINNPLTVIAGYVEMLTIRLESVGSLHGADLQAVREDVATLAKQVNTCAAITRRYLRFVNKRSPQAPEVSVNQVLDDIQTLMRNHPSIKGGKLAIKHLNVDTAAQIGGTELIQILLNLCMNAFQSASQPQTVWVTAERFDIKLPTETFRDNPSERYIGSDSFVNQPPVIAVSVLDQGPGIPSDVLARIFEPYFTTKALTGTGLGLAIVSRLVKAHHGLVHVKSSPGEGTRFTIYLPAKEPNNSGTPF